MGVARRAGVVDSSTRMSLIPGFASSATLAPYCIPCSNNSKQLLHVYCKVAFTRAPARSSSMPSSGA